MSPSLEPIVDFLSRTAPFDQVGAEIRADLARRLEVEYHRRGTELRSLGAAAERLYFVRSGALSESDRATLLVSRYGEGEIAGVEDLLTGEPARTSLKATEDCLLYSLPRKQFEELLARHVTLAQTFTSTVGQRLRQAALDLARAEPSLGSTTEPLETLLTRPLVSIDAAATIRDAARLMKEQRVSALAVTGQTRLGIITDRDLRNRVLAAGLSSAEPVAAIMTNPTVTIDRRAPIFEALLLMLEREIHHLVVTDDNHPVGLVSTTDLVRAQSENPVHVVGEINKQTTLAGLARANGRRNMVLVRLVASGARAGDIHRVLSRIADAVTCKLIKMAEAELRELQLGPMPEHCWAVFGSLARSEITLGSDQDNALILTDGCSPDDPSARFLAERVCEGLSLCGYPKCNGEIMAMVPRWRQPANTWAGYFQKWIRTPEKNAVMHASIFFDLRGVEGNIELLGPLRELIAAEVAKEPLFLAYMARDAMTRRPPLGFFRQFVVEKEGEHVDTLDLKHRGLIPIVDLARVLALEAGYTGPNTADRLLAAEEHGTVSRSGASELMSAFEFIALLRLKHQARAISRFEQADSYLRPDDLSPTDRRHLHDAFKVIKTIQDSLHFSHQLGGLAG